MKVRKALTGNEAMAEAMRQINPDVIAAYPITPQTEIVQLFSNFVADGKVDTEFVTVESEHSAMSATIGASAAGSRAMTATSSQGMAYMWEVLYIAASMRLPIVMPLVNRALSGPINIHCDHSDAYGARDSGWIQLWAENAQEAYDNLIQAVRIAEHSEVTLPVMVNMDGFIISHGLEIMEAEDDDTIRNFIGVRKPVYHLLNEKEPITMGPLDLQDFYFEHKKQQADAMARSADVIREISKEWKDLTGRSYDMLEEYRMEDAEIAIVALGSTCGTAKVAIDQLREQGVKAGLVKIRVFRPFPKEEIAKALAHTKAVAVMDRAESFADFGGPLFRDVRASLYECDSRPKTISYIYGLGGRDVTLDTITQVYADLQRLVKGEQVPMLNHLGVRD
ncbi:MAG: transketolase C-terminal domain-containing protein [Firmicutes bacterium]|nr:transketolase C-terminal domain-containing protein [Bacillota bacterium]MDD4694198.1 transketolase C-terminal domain-containing protein [Bacillota bacterium]